MTTATTTANSGTQTTDLTKFPPQIKFIVGNEACERLSYYGVVAILTGYATILFGGGEQGGRDGGSGADCEGPAVAGVSASHGGSGVAAHRVLVVGVVGGIWRVGSCIASHHDAATAIRWTRQSAGSPSRRPFRQSSTAANCARC